MDEGGSRTVTATIMTLGLAAVLTVGALWAPAPFRLFRPTVANPVSPPPQAQHEILARHWEDPLGVVRSEIEVPSNGRSRAYRPIRPDQVALAPQMLARIRSDLAGRPGAPRGWSADDGENPLNGDTLILPVFISGRPYSDAEQTRLETRYAVLSALGSRGYSPGHYEKLRYFIFWPTCDPDSMPRVISVAWPGGPASGSLDTDAPLAIPYEWCVAGESAPAVAPRRVLILWVDASHPTAKNALQFMNDLIGALGVGGHDAPCESFRLAALGPTNSNELSSLLIEDVHLHSEGGRRLAALRALVSGNMSGEANHSVRPHIYSYFPTIPNSRLKRELVNWLRLRNAPDDVGAFIGDDFFSDGAAPAIGASSSPAGRDDGLSLFCGAVLHRTTLCDMAMLRALVDEMRLRGVRPETPKQTIAIISEWDTLYGRAWPDMLSEVVGPEGTKRLRFYSYLRGVDGDERAAGAAARGQAGETGAPATSVRTAPRLAKSSTAPEHPTGVSQLDYVRRLVDKLRSDARRDGARVAAIGVLGSDVHDKLVMLQALRPEFPGAVFFTTDLEADYMHPSVDSFARNLIVASTFGLRLGTLQDKTPPFRGAYQTAAYYSCLRAIEDASIVAPSCEESASRNQPTSPLLFEISRHGAFRLDTSAETPLHPPSPRASIIPERLGWWQRFVILPLGALALAAILTYVLFLHSVERRPPFERPRWRIGGAAIVRRGLRGFLFFGVIPLAFALLALIDGSRPNGEPLAMLAGVSAWPSDLMRLYVLVLCLWWHLHMCNRFRREDVRLSRLALGNLTAGGALKRRVLTETVSQLSVAPFRDVRLFAWRAVPRRKHDRLEISGESLIQELLLRSTWQARAMRTIVVLTLHLVFVSALFVLFPPVPGLVRGGVARAAHLVIVYASVIAMSSLAVFIWDAARLCSRFAWCLSGDVAVHWPKRLTGGKWPASSAEDDVAQSRVKIRLLARMTEEVGQLVYFPFIALVLLILARNSRFDRWPWSASLVLAYLSAAAMALLAVITLNRAAESLRRAELRRLRARRHEAISRGNPPEATRIYDQAVQDIAGVREGAFRPALSQPTIHALALAVAGIGAYHVIELLDWAM